jgi:hypothetical protein
MKKIIEKNTFLAPTNSKLKIFSKCKTTNDDLNYLAKFVEQRFSKIHLDASESAKTLFVTSPKLKILIKNMFYFIGKEPKKSIKTFLQR